MVREQEGHFLPEKSVIHTLVVLRSAFNQMKGSFSAPDKFVRN